MTNDLVTELRQTKPFHSLAQEAQLSVIRTGAVLMEGIEQLLKPYGISATQYNVLRILRGAGQDGLCRNEIRDRLVNRMPDVSRLLDRMEAAGLVARERDTADRRLVSTRLTETGRQLVDDLDGPMDAEDDRQLGHMDEADLRELLRLLALARRAG